MSFEKAFARLEKILEAMNSGEASLDEALRLYEEADRLISHCSKRLNEAEAKIEVLIKNREGQEELDAAGEPQTAAFGDG